MMAIVPATGQIRLIDPRTLRDLATLTSPEVSSPEPQRINWLAFSPDSAHLAAACRTPRAVQLWDLRLIRRQLAQMGLDWELPPYPSLEGDQPRTVAVADLAKSRRIVADGGERVLIHEPRGSRSALIAFSPDGQRIITGGDDRTVRVSQIVSRAMRPVHRWAFWLRLGGYSSPMGSAS